MNIKQKNEQEKHMNKERDWTSKIADRDTQKQKQHIEFRKFLTKKSCNPNLEE